VITANGVVEVLLVDNRDILECERHHEMHVFCGIEVLPPLL
jgi:hypothetical protein